MKKNSTKTDWQKIFFTVTPLSKLLALLLFILLPIVAFFYGRYYERRRQVQNVNPMMIRWMPQNQNLQK